MAKKPAVSVAHMANLLKEIWDSDAACADRPWRASQLVLTWWRTALREEALGEGARSEAGREPATGTSKRVGARKKK